MTEREGEIFFELYESLPRQGPGNRASAERALELCDGLPESPAVLDLGCGSGGQTLHLVELTGGHVTAMDSHAPLIERLKATVEQRGLGDRVRPVVGDMGNPGLEPASFDLAWSEGALYFIGIPEALAVCAELVRPGGYLVFTDAVWLRPDAPPEVKASFAEYPAMGTARDLVETVARSDWVLVDHFPLPEEAWWEDFYTPMERRLAEMRGKYAGDEEALAILDALDAEPRMYREHATSFGYEFLVLRRPGAAADPIP